MRHAAAEADAHHYLDKSELIRDLADENFANTVILIKGSRSMGLEKVMDVL